MRDRVGVECPAPPRHDELARAGAEGAGEVGDKAVAVEIRDLKPVRLGPAGIADGKNQDEADQQPIHGVDYTSAGWGAARNHEEPAK
jgi:hypothetical protein